MKQSEVLARRKKYLAPTYANRGIAISRGEGVFLYDAEGKEYLDCFSNYGVNILGHANSVLKKAMTEQMSTLSNLHCSFPNEKRILFAQKLCDSAGMDKVFFCNSGTEAIEAAIKFSLLITGRKKILAAKNGYHGKTMGALSLTSTLKKYKEPYGALLDGVTHIEYGDIASLKKAIDESVAAVFLEPIQGESGIRIVEKGYFSEVKKLCEEHGALLIIDEVQTGMGRTGTLFAIEQEGIQPDMICLAKGFAGGIPAGAVLLKEKCCGEFYPGCHTNTFGGNPLVCAVGLAVLEEIEKRKLLAHVMDVGAYFLEKLEGLREIKKYKIKEVRGRGLMLAIELREESTAYVKKLQEEGVIAIPTGKYVIRFLPPLIFEKQHVDRVVEILTKVLE